MVVAISGVLTHKEPTFVVLKCANGLSYGVFVSLFCSASLSLNEKVELFITQLIKEDSNRFFGFLQKEEQLMFESLLKVNGIGPSTAMAICSSMSVPDFYKALLNADENAFKKAPGIGAKSAKRIIIELGDKKLNMNSLSSEKTQAMQALDSLGFKQDKAIEALGGCVSKDVSELVKEALKKLS